MEAVLPAMAKGVQAICGQLTADAIAERAVERREHGLRFAECEWKKWQCAGRCHLAECRPRHKEFESTRAQIGEHFWVGPEPALGKHLEAKFAAGLPVDRLGLSAPPSPACAPGSQIASLRSQRQQRHGVIARSAATKQSRAMSRAISPS